MLPVKTALLSFGMSGKVFHAPFINIHKGFQLAGAWERSKKSIQEIYPAAVSYPTLESILQDETIDLVIVNTPTYTHYEYTKAALLAGKHVIVEKAFTTTTAEAVELKELAEKQHKKLNVFQNRRWDSDFKTVKEINDAGWLGAIVEAEFRFERYKPALSPKLHKENTGPGAGLFNDLGPHLIDQALYLFGMPQALYADIRITRPLSKVDDWFEVSLQYKDKRVKLKSGLLVREPLPAFVLQGTKGSFIKSRGDVQEAELTAGKIPGGAGWGIEPETGSGLLHTEKDGAIIREKIKTVQGNYYEYYDAVYKAITEDAPLPVTADDGINVMRIIEASVSSNSEKKLVAL